MAGMPSPRRTTWLLLMLAILASHASLTLHFTSHVAADQGCELCTHYSNFEHAAPPPAVASFAPAAHAPEPSTTAAVPPAAEFAPCRQRGPPQPA
jgi:hypothetical protein